MQAQVWPKQVLKERAMVWDAGLLGAKVVALAAHRSAAEGRTQARVRFLDRVMELALGSLARKPVYLNEEAEAAGFERWSLAFGFQGAALARACRVFNRAPDAERRAFWGLVVEGRGLDEVAHERWWDASRTARAAHELLVQFYGILVTPIGPRQVFGCAEPATNQHRFNHPST